MGWLKMPWVSRREPEDYAAFVEYLDNTLLKENGTSGERGSEYFWFCGKEFVSDLLGERDRLRGELERSDEEARKALGQVDCLEAIRGQKKLNEAVLKKQLAESQSKLAAAEKERDEAREAERTWKSRCTEMQVRAAFYAGGVVRVEEAVHAMKDDARRFHEASERDRKSQEALPAPAPPEEQQAEWDRGAAEGSQAVVSLMKAEEPEEPAECEHEWAKFGVDSDGAWTGGYRCEKCGADKPKQAEEPAETDAYGCLEHLDQCGQVCKECGLEVDEYGNTEDSFQYCSFPDCGCDGARLCMAGEASDAAASGNVEGMWTGKTLLQREAGMRLMAQVSADRREAESKLACPHECGNSPCNCAEAGNAE